MTVHVRTIALYLFCTLLSYLAGVYFGGILLALFVLFLLFPVVSTLVLLHWFVSFEFYQSFTTYQALRGQNVEYWLFLRNEAALPLHRVVVRFHAPAANQDEMLPPFVTSLGQGERIERRFQVAFPHRGVYPVGMASIEISDFLSFFSMHRTISPRYFAVYPTICELADFAIEWQELRAQASSRPAIRRTERSYFGWLREYRDGEPVGAICWKKFATTGKPYLKEYEGAAGGVARIYFDLDQCTDPEYDTLSQQDTSVEVLIAVVKFLLDRGITTEVVAAGDPSFRFEGDHPSCFQTLYQATTELVFHRAPSPAQLYQNEYARGILDRSLSSVVLITHRIDPALIAVMEGMQDSHNRIALILIQVGSPREDNADRERLLALAPAAVQVIAVKDQTTMPLALAGDMGMYRGVGSDGS